MRTHRASRTRRALVGSALAAAVSLGSLTGTTLLGTHPAGADAPGRAIDFFTETFSDPLDFSNPQDLVVADEGPMEGATDVVLADGKLAFDMAPRDGGRGGYLSPLWGGYPGAMGHGREGSFHPVDTSRFRRLVFRLNAPAGIPSGVRYYTCPSGVSDACQGGVNFFTEEGWHTYEFLLGPSDVESLTAPWTGKATGIRLAFSPPTKAHFELDFVQLLTDPDASGNVTADGGTAGPVPQVLNPDAAGAIPVVLNADGSVLQSVNTGPCGDYTRFARNGDSWDFSQKSDVAGVDNLDLSEVTGGLFHGVSTAAPDGRPGDPGVRMALGAKFRPTDFSHATAVVPKFAGSYSQRFDKGGGWVLRFLWKFDAVARWQVSRQIATYPNERVFSVDLADPHPFDGLPTVPTDATDTESPGLLGWAVPDQWVNLFRVDPHEDYEPRDFWFDQIWLAQDDCGRDSFDILFRDNAFAPGTTADIYVDANATGFDGQLVAQNVPVNAGVNTYRWANAQPGRWWVYVVLHRGDSVGRAYSTGPVRIGAFTPTFPPGSSVTIPAAPQTLAFSPAASPGRRVCTIKKVGKRRIRVCA